MSHPRSKIILDRMKEKDQESIFSLEAVVSETIRSAQFIVVEEVIKEIYNTKILKKDDLMKYRNRIIKNVSSVKAKDY